MATSTPSQAFLQLTSAQTLALKSAASRGDGAVSLPDRLKGKAAETFVAALIAKDLAREVQAKPGMPVSRRDAETGRSYGLVVTRLGRNAIAAAANPVRATELGANAVEAPRVAPGPTMAVGGAAASAAPSKPAPSKVPGTVSRATQPKVGHSPRQGSKIAAVIALLSRHGGAGVEDLMAATGWLPHTTRAALTGLRKRGLAIVRERPDDRGTVYRIAPASAPEAA